jgi:AcrR family transcriptional regulator
MYEGLRERKKRKMRELIAQTAAELFEERGFEGVTIAQLAAAADVAEKTIFNYFPAKEDLVFDRDHEFQERLVKLVDSSAPGTPLVERFRSFWLSFVDGMVGEAEKRGKGMSVLVRSSPALRERLLSMEDRHRQALELVIRKRMEFGDDPVTPGVLAGAIMSIQHSLIDLHGQLKTRNCGRLEIEARLREYVERSCAILSEGLGGYRIP